jgi:hypothetical protein
LGYGGKHHYAAQMAVYCSDYCHDWCAVSRFPDAAAAAAASSLPSPEPYDAMPLLRQLPWQQHWRAVQDVADEIVV